MDNSAAKHPGWAGMSMVALPEGFTVRRVQSLWTTQQFIVLLGLEESEGLQNVRRQRFLALQHTEQLGVVQLRQDGHDLLGQVRVHVTHQRKQALNQRLEESTDRV